MAGKLIRCGRIGRPVGLKGECAVGWASGESPVGVGDEIIIQDAEGEGHTGHRIAALRTQGRYHFLRLEGVSDRTAASSFTNRELFIDEDSLPPTAEGEFYCHQIVGMEVVAEDGTGLGRVVRIFRAGDNDVYEVMPEKGRTGEEILIPAIDSVVLAIDVDAKRITVRPMQGMLDR